MHSSHRRCSFRSHILVATTTVMLGVGGGCIEIDFWADRVAVLVLGFTVLVVAILSATSGKQFLLSWLGKQDIHIAFDLLGSRPIDLAILLQALLGLVGSFELSLASSPAFIVGVFAIQIMASFIFTIGNLTLCLLAITLGIHLHIGVIGSSALVVQNRPLL